MKTICVIQARMGSTRLSGKVLTDLGGYPVLAWVVRACKAATGIDKVVVATTTNEEDQKIVEWCEANSTTCIRGSETDVLSRFVDVQTATQADVLLRVTGDEPFVDPQVISAVVRLRKEKNAGYCSNIHPRSYPDGLDVECFTSGVLAEASQDAKRPIDRDTVTYWMYRNGYRLARANVTNPLPNMAKERWVLDTAQDLEFCKAIAERWPWDKGPPTQYDILGILDKEPDLRKLNAGHIMNERFYEALSEEKLEPREYPLSKLLLQNAEVSIPLGAQTFSKSKLQFPEKHPLFVTHGEGAYIYDVDGHEYVDLVSALLPNILGYCDSDVDYAVREQIDRGASLSLSTDLEQRLAAKLNQHIPCAEMVRFGKTGTDVTSAAVRLARAHTGREDIVRCHGNYHGWADWAVPKDKMRNLGVPDVGKTWDESKEDVIKTLEMGTEIIAGIIIEADQDQDFLRELRLKCSQTGTVLIFDEVITGFRWSMGGAQLVHGVTPDLACFGKAMGNGYSISALVGRRDIMQLMEKVCFSGTFFGETIGFAAALATIDKIEREDVISHIRHCEKMLYAHVKMMLYGRKLNDHIQIQDGPLCRLTFKDNDIKALFMQEMAQQGVLIIATHNFTYSHKMPELNRIVNAYAKALDQIKDALDKGDIKARIGDSSISPTVRESG